MTTKEDVKEWVSAALVHDAGKLTTPKEVLDSKSNYRGGSLSPEERKKKDAEFDIIMKHSLDGLSVAKEKGFTKEELGACIGHHVCASALERGLAEWVKGASYSKKQWPRLYKDPTVEDILQENLNWISEKDVRTLETIALCYVVEAVRSGKRAYQGEQEIHWGSEESIDEERKPQTVFEIVFSDSRPNFIIFGEQPLPDFGRDIIRQEEFRDRVEFFEGSNIAATLNEQILKPIEKAKEALLEISADSKEAV